MTIQKPPSNKKINKVIERGGSSPKASSQQEEEVKKFQMVIPQDLCKLIDDDRNITGTSRRSWLLQAAKEKLEREGKI